MCDKKPCDKCCHDEDLICCMPLVHCCGGYSEHNNCCPHNRCCNSCCGGCGCCDDCCECCYCKYYKLLRELKDRLENAENRITNLESQLESSIEYLKKYIDKKYNDILISVPCSVSYKIVDGVKTFVYTRFTDDQGNTEDVKITDINQIRDDLALDYMNDVLSYSGFSSFPVNGEYNGAPDVIYIDEGLNKIYWYNKNASGTGRDKYQLLASTNYDDLGDKPKLNTNNSSSLSTNSSEIIQGTIKLHKISKTGSYSDLSEKPFNNTPDLRLVLDNTTFKIKAQLLDGGSVVKESNEIDLPIESLVVNGRYENGNLYLTLQNGSEVGPIDISDIISGLLKPADLKKIDTTNDTTLSTSSSEAINGSGKINLHKISKTGKFSDIIIDQPTSLQSDWDQTDNTKQDFIKNKPNISGKADKSDAIGKVTFDRTTGDLKFYSIASPNSNPLYTINLLWKEDSTNNNITYTSGTSKSVTAGGFYDNTVS